jgi:hypothetical protein
MVLPPWPPFGPSTYPQPPTGRQDSSAMKQMPWESAYLLFTTSEALSSSRVSSLSTTTCRQLSVQTASTPSGG